MTIKLIEYSRLVYSDELIYVIEKECKYRFYKV